MHCQICDKDSDTVTLEDPCSECQEVIYDCLKGYEPTENDEDDDIVDEEFDNA